MQLFRPIKIQIAILLLLIAALLTSYSVRSVFPQASSGTVVKINASSSTLRIGETLSVNITLANVQNLYGLDVILRWNASTLSVLNVVVRLGVESHPEGVLHEILPDAQVYVAENTVSQELGEYHLAATSVAPASPFSGNGIIATLTFNVTNLGNSKLDLETKLYDYPPSDRDPRITLPIEHTDIDGFVGIIPEFSTVAILALCLILVTAVVAFFKKLPLQHSPSHAL